MTDDEPSIRTFSLKSIGPEPTGTTPIEEEDLEGLIPDFVATRADLNRVEFDNISKALTWGIQQARVLGPDGILEYGFLMKLHRQMFSDVWKWAGTNRRRITNVGSLLEVIVSEAHAALEDMKYWHANGVFEINPIRFRRLAPSAPSIPGLVWINPPELEVAANN